MGPSSLPACCNRSQGGIFFLTLDTCLTQRLSWPNLRAQHKTSSCLMAASGVCKIAPKTCPLAVSTRGLSCFCCPDLVAKDAQTLNLKLMLSTPKGSRPPQFLWGSEKGGYNCWEILRCDGIYLYTDPGGLGPQGFLVAKRDF